MSGPKCVTIGLTPRELERQRWEAMCAAALSEYARSMSEVGSLAARSAHTGLDVDAVPLESAEALAVRTYGLVAAERGAEAHATITAEIDRLRAERARLSEAYASHVRDVQRRHGLLTDRVAQLHTRAARLRARVAEADAASGVEETRKRVRATVMPALLAVDELSDAVPAFGLDAEALRLLCRAEEAIDRAARALADGADAIESLIDHDHGARVREAVATTQSLAAEPVPLVIGSPTQSSVDDPQSERLGDLLSRLAVDADGPQSDCVRDMIAELREVRAASDVSDRQTRFEALMLRCSGVLRERRRVAARRKEIEALVDGAAHVRGPEVERALRDIRERGLSLEDEEFQRVAVRLRALVAEYERAADAARRRAALLDSLAALGYRPVGAMQTGEVRGGRLYVQRRDETEYAVEVVTDSDMSLLQTALVRVRGDIRTGEQQRLRDKEREEEWCGEHARIRGELDTRGYETAFKLERPAGAHPVRYVAGIGARDERNDEQGAPARSRQAGRA